ncbi:unnamed protein product [Macrosiphum euphorbiae]|uniref:Tc1-like transposase DDE domain-containing protein n=1 Tax=Macrosiphum euphorbiae TaxID=13131 RepID=A0AAV0Y8Z7_9HEMI|nr:unnamed protein product [Macrosiphum euphorbiae]
MNAAMFKKWFIDMLNHLEEPCVIVMDNASYHSVLSVNYPKSNAIKSIVKQWLRENGVDFSPLETLSELRKRVKSLIPKEKNMNLMKLHFRWAMKLCVCRCTVSSLPGGRISQCRSVNINEVSETRPRCVILLLGIRVTLCKAKFSTYNFVTVINYRIL